ncbi:MAG: tetratricopeptide repeat protein [Acidobacteria bacterium]|nr:MAG: tetratricopeptide repeat protein [Acidobacteriota bacterium]
MRTPLRQLVIVTALVAAAGCGPSTPPPPAPPKDVTFTRDVAPVFYANCVTCHREGEVAPFPLFAYADAKKHAKEIGEETAARHMPPWLPEPGEFPIEGNRRLRQDQIDLIQRWVKGGALEGNAADLPKAPVFPGGWQTGTPDLIVTLPKPFMLKPSPRDVYRNLVMRVPLDATKYVRAVEFKTGGAPVHHAVIRVDRTTTSRRRDGMDGQPGFEGMARQGAQDPGGHFIGWAPGRGPIVSPKDMPWRLDRGADLVLEVHLIPGDQPIPVQPTVALYLTDTPPTRSPMTVRMGTEIIDIPAGKSDYVVTDTYTLPVPVELLSVMPHAHYLGKDMLVTAALPGGATKTLIHIKEWEFHWQQNYRYLSPIALPAGTTLTMKYTFDNSDDNPENPMHPPVRVMFGPNSTDEMAELGLQLMPQTTADAERLVRDFNERADQQHLELAEKQVRDEPSNPDHLEYLGSMYLAQGRVADAIGLLERAIRINDRTADAHNDLGNALMAQGRTAEALPHFRKAAAQTPKDERVFYNLGNALDKLNRPAEAVAAYTRALAINGDFTDAHVNLGSLLFSRGRAKDALPHFQRAVELEPGSAMLLNNLAGGLAASGRFPEAMQYVRRALAIDPGYQPALDNLRRLQGMGIR